MRIIAGEFKGRTIKVPAGVQIRPTSQRVKEALFSIVGEGIRQAAFLDLCAGSGNIAIEARSRGAEVIVLAENNRLCLKTIKANLKALGIAYSCGLPGPGGKRGVRARVLPVDAERAVGALAQQEQKFDFVFLDPPYYHRELKNMLIKPVLCDILKPLSYVILEHNTKEGLPHLASGLKLMFIKRYGDSTLSFFQGS